ncbi:uncharacterized protein BO97DRAFT_124150 [Aspergillus homomorphus CBS 101889]|uniref:Uncharacterized protein n=1 Tax=Aspergillus homomorphus (strain CBS 101889) TaxID=1450537 RepID=A0A395HS42_ASPHC|nr:hypothetical protein BO97DRAFT_124150 [Aspergillus homomorphus CBS 101889]RAL10637.1 hypothetical protein BO97DRAFT_124150 [Aspergillus homomorphus CBS 101889]
MGPDLFFSLSLPHHPFFRALFPISIRYRSTRFPATHTIRVRSLHPVTLSLMFPTLGIGIILDSVWLYLLLVGITFWDGQRGKGRGRGLGWVLGCAGFAGGLASAGRLRTGKLSDGTKTNQACLQCLEVVLLTFRCLHLGSQ